ncbi:MAG: LON peptidase substrate-binding domain-containing protein [Cyclobacteriaceae bacterium]
MSLFLPLFPLNLVAFPGEQLNLHIFEPRYKQLVNDCFTGDSPFGIPSYIHNKIEYGTMINIIEVYKVYKDGRLDLKTRGEVVIKIESFENPIKGKQYAGGQVTLIEDIDDHAPQQSKMTLMLQELYDKLTIEAKVPIGSDVNTYDIAHKIGLSMEQEYELLQIPRKSERVDYIVDHLSQFIPKLSRVEEVKERIRMNGHFKRLDKLNF